MLSTALVLSVLTTIYATRFVYASPVVDRRAASVVQLGGANVAGTVSGSVESFLGIPYAQPPVGNLRFRLPQLRTTYEGAVDATAFGNQCLQSPVAIPSTTPPEVLQGIFGLSGFLTASPEVSQSEDCLYLNVIRPATTTPDAKLPVLFWMHGGAFALGSNAMPVYNGSRIVERSVEIGEPVVFVAINYRLNVFGFLGGHEVKDAGVGNLGLHDQRAALRWVQKFISGFGGDPQKVTIWGESAGAMSVSLHMLTNGGNTEGLFRAAIMSSGGPVSTGDITGIQGTFDTVAKRAGCSGSPDVLNCLRSVSTEDLVKAAGDVEISIGYSGLAIPYMPRADGVFIKAPPQRLAHDGALAKVPFITGSVTDEGTIFSLGSMNITTSDQLADYLGKVWFPGATRVDTLPALALYPPFPSSGSPYNTGNKYTFDSQFKRVASIQGDWFFNAPRRLLLQKSKQTAYTYLHSRGNYPGLGQPHTTDLLNAFGPGDLTDYFIRFVNDLNPNGASGVHWPKFDIVSRQKLQFDDTPVRVVQDYTRLGGTEALTALSRRFPF
ncbi:carotenoid ester lipase precursor [Daedaleopsis nitida]|nr:carotenoid ester lipase precursor [Daedaleopsis nitida]